MPSFTLSGYADSSTNTPIPTTVEVVFGNNIDSFSYRYFGGSEEILALTGVPRAFEIGGENVLDTATFLLSELVWGAGMSTIILDVYLGDEAIFTAELAGVGLLDDVVAGGRPAAREMFLTAAYSGQVQDEDFAPRTIIALDDLFGQPVEDLSKTGTDGADRLRGTGAQDVLWGYGGKDVLLGRGGADTILSGAGADTARGQGGNDVISGYGGNDKIYGGAGADVLGGGKGRDLLVGGGGADSFAFDRGDGNDVIRDMEGRDVLILSTRLWQDPITIAEIVAGVEVSGDDLVLTFGRGGSLTLEGLTQGDLTEAMIQMF